MPFAGLLALAAFSAAVDAPPPVSALLEAVRSGDLAAAQATLSEDAVIMDERSGEPVSSTLRAFVDAVRACEPGIVSAGRDEADPERAAATISWSCPSASRSESLVWTQGPRVVWIQFGMPAPE
jgi:hypothetical protein